MAEPSRAASQDVNLAVNEALASMPALDRDVFLMREVAGLGYEEIAGACDLSADARSFAHPSRAPPPSTTTRRADCHLPDDGVAARGRYARDD
jgi:hypothetical protein